MKGGKEERGEKKERSRAEKVQPAGHTAARRPRRLRRRECEISIVNQTAPQRAASFVAAENHRRVSRLAPISPFIVIASLYGANYHGSGAHAAKLKLKSLRMSADNDNEARRRC